MKKLLLSTTLAASIGATGAAYAQSGTDLFRTEAQASEILASDFIGMRVHAVESGATGAEAMGLQDGWEDVGEINDVILNRDGGVEAVLVDIGGFLGLGERQVALRMDSIDFVSDGDTAAEDDFFLVIPASRADLEEAPEYSSAALTQGTDMASETGTGAEGAAIDGMASDAPVGGDDSMTMPAAREGYVAADPAMMTSENLTGAAVYGSSDEWIGDVSELVLTEGGDIDQVLIDVGGFLGIGEKPVALAFDEIDIVQADGGDDLRVFVAMTQDELEELPTYEN